MISIIYKTAFESERHGAVTIRIECNINERMSSCKQKERGNRKSRRSRDKHTLWRTEESGEECIGMEKGAKISSCIYKTISIQDKKELHLHLEVQSYVKNTGIFYTKRNV